MHILKKSISILKQCETEFERYKVYLYPGVYRIYTNHNRYSWKKEPRWSRWVIGILLHSNIAINKRIKIVLLAKKKRVSENGIESCGDELYVTRKKQLKIFDHQKGEVRYYPFNNQLLKQAALFNNEYAPFFDNRIIKDIDNTNMYITERYVIEFLDWRRHTEKVIVNMKMVWSDLISYTHSASNNRASITIDAFCLNVKRLSRDTCFENTVDYIINALKASKRIPIIPLINQHNDLVLSNILIDNNGVTVFDYEFYASNIFFYDAMMFIVWEAMQYGNNEYLNMFMEGRFDTNFASLFSAIGSSFCSDLKAEYVKIFLLANISLRICNHDRLNEEKYYRVLKFLENYV